MAKSTYLENKLLDHALATTAYTKPTTVYVALYTTNPTVADSGTEVSGGSYARQTVAFAAATGGSAANSGTVTFTGMPAVTVSHVGIRDAATVGNLLHFAPLTAPKTLNAGDTLTFNVSSIAVTEA